MLSPENIRDFKEQLSQQIQHLPEEQHQKAQQQIDELSPEALEHLLEEQQQQNVLRKIVDKEISAVIVGENTTALAVLDIYPISEGHTIIIPKSPISDVQHLPLELFTLAKELSKHITEHLKATKVEMQTEIKFGEAVLNLIPIYDMQLTLASPRKKVSLDDLKSIASRLAPPEKSVIQKVKKPVPEGPVIQIKRRIP